jgi:hypothetical protein
VIFREVERLQAQYVQSPVRVPDLGDWVAEVRQLEAEFGAVEIRWDDTTIRVVTEPVVLDDVYLGAFAIDFFWDRVGRLPATRCFDVIALDPNPAIGRDEVVHPHVRDGTLCPGDANETLDRALAAGRLTDAFLLVRSVLLKYNPHSPYVSLDDWNGIACAECGRRVDEDDRSICEACGADLCEACPECCAACSATRCGQCTEPCDACQAACCPCCLEATDAGQAICPGCVPRCSRCSAAVPATELSDATQLCSNCNPEDDDDENDAPDTRDTTEVPVATE